MRSRKPSPSTRWKGLFAAALSLALVLLAAAGYGEGWFRLPREAFPGGPPEEEGLTLYMADVGQGLAMLLQCGGESAVIDTGPPDTAEDFAREVSLRAPEGLKYVFLTHPHQDHCGGAKALFSAVEAETLVISDCGDREAALQTAWPSSPPRARKQRRDAQCRCCAAPCAPPLPADSRWFFLCRTA